MRRPRVSVEHWALVAATTLACSPEPRASPKSTDAEVDLEAAPARDTSEAAPVPTEDRQLSRGLTYRRLPLEGDHFAHVFEADLRHVEITAIDATAGAEGGRRAATVQQLREESEALLVVNATFFDPEQRPLGLLVDHGRTLSKLRSADWGVLTVDADHSLDQVHTRDFRDDLDPVFAVQCGPRVVIDGEPPKLRPQRARRTGLCIQDRQRLAVFVVDRPIAAAALASWLAAAPGRGGLGCQEAMLLDGGPSTQLSASAGAWSLDVMGLWPVPTAIALRSR